MNGIELIELILLAVLILRSRIIRIIFLFAEEEMLAAAAPRS